MLLKSDKTLDEITDIFETQRQGVQDAEDEEGSDFNIQLILYQFMEQ